MKQIKVDESAHRILLEVKEEMREEGVERPTHSEAVRWMKRHIGEL